MEQVSHEIWTAACCGDIKTLKGYYTNGGEKNLRHEKFGTQHSLIAGAYRNGHIETVRYLYSEGEMPEGHERGELRLCELRLFFLDFLANNEWEDENVKKQARAIFTTICLMGDIEADSYAAECILYEAYTTAVPEIEYEDFCEYMYDNII